MSGPESFTRYFDDLDGHIWLNAASEGPLPLVSRKALEEAIVWKSRPYLLDIPKFAQVPQKLKTTLGEFFNINSRDIILGNSASYGLHLLANGLPWDTGDEILVMQNDFPTNILPWLALEKKGVVVKQLKPKNFILRPEELEKAITVKTKLFCISQVHTFTGLKLDVEQFAAICRKKNVVCVINLSQSAGTMPIDVSQWNVDAVVCAGYKWLCGPYGTGMAWFSPELRSKLDINLSYWCSVLSDEELQSEGKLKYREISSARKYDVFGTANFFNFVPFESSVRLLLDIGIPKIVNYQKKLVGHFTKNFDLKKFQLLSSTDPLHQSCLIVISHQDQSKNKAVFDRLKSANIHVAFWKGNIRVSPHIYNTIGEIDRCLSVIHHN